MGSVINHFSQRMPIRRASLSPTSSQRRKVRRASLPLPFSQRREIRRASLPTSLPKTEDKTRLVIPLFSLRKGGLSAPHCLSLVTHPGRHDGTHTVRTHPGRQEGGIYREGYPPTNLRREAYTGGIPTVVHPGRLYPGLYLPLYTQGGYTRV